MNKKLALVSGIASLVLTACASQQERVTASGSYEYLKSKERTQLQVPTELDAPEFTSDYNIPALQQSADSTLVGRNLEVVPPAAASARVAPWLLPSRTSEAPLC